MTNILIMLLLLTGPYLALRLVTIGAPSRAHNPSRSLHDAAAWGAALLFAYTALGHFMQTEQLAAMLPPDVPERIFLVHLTGVVELLIAAGLLYRPTRRAAGLAAVVVLIAFSPANIYAAVNRLPFSGNEWGPIYLLVRMPLQVFIVFWIFRWVLRQRRSDAQTPDTPPYPELKE